MENLILQVLLYLLFYVLPSFLGIFSLINLIFIFILVLMAFSRPKSKQRSYYPNFTVVIPAYNEEKNIASCLDSVLALDYDKRKLEIICVDDASEDDTLKVIRKYAKKYKNINLLISTHEGKSLANNKGVEFAKNEIILLLDADMYLETSFLKNIAHKFKDRKVACAFGPILISPTKKLIDYYQAIEYCYMNLVRISFTKIFGYPMWFCCPAVCFRKNALRKLGGFENDTLTEDLDITFKLFGSRYKVVYAEEAVATTLPVNSLASVIKQRMRWYYGGIQNLIKHRKRFNLASLLMLYVFFSFYLWLLNSIIMFLNFSFTISSLAIKEPTSALNYFAKTGTIAGPLLAFQHLEFLQQNPIQYAYLTIGILLLLLIGFSILKIGKEVNLGTIFAFFTYFTYIGFLQMCFILSFLKYSRPRSSNPVFIKEG